MGKGRNKRERMKRDMVYFSGESRKELKTIRIKENFSFFSEKNKAFSRLGSGMRKY